MSWSDTPIGGGLSDSGSGSGSGSDGVARGRDGSGKRKRGSPNLKLLDGCERLGCGGSARVREDRMPRKGCAVTLDKAVDIGGRHRAQVSQRPKSGRSAWSRALNCGRRALRVGAGDTRNMNCVSAVRTAPKVHVVVSVVQRRLAHDTRRRRPRPGFGVGLVRVRLMVRGRFGPMVAPRLGARGGRRRLGPMVPSRRTTCERQGRFRKITHFWSQRFGVVVHRVRVCVRHKPRTRAACLCHLFWLLSDTHGPAFIYVRVDSSRGC